MSEKEIYKKVILYGLLLSVILSLILYLILKDISIIKGIFLGVFARIIGFVAIIINSFSILSDSKNAYKSVVGYFVRLVFYGLVVVLTIKININIIGLLIGLSIINVVLYLTQMTLLKGGK